MQEMNVKSTYLPHNCPVKPPLSPKVWGLGMQLTSALCPGARFSKVPIINGPLRAVVVYMQDRSFNSFALNLMKPSVNETKWSILLARTGALILFISI